MFVHYEVAIFKPLWVLTLDAASDRNAPSYKEEYWINDMMDLYTRKHKRLSKEVHWSHLLTFL